MTLALAACGGGSGSSPGTDTQGAGGNTGLAVTIQGAAVKGIVKHAKIVAQELQSDGTVTQTLGSTTTDSNGHYSLSVPDTYGGGPVLLTLSDAADPAQPTSVVCDVAAGCGAQTPFGADYPIGAMVMKALLGKASSGTITAAITPLTTTAAAAALGDVASGQPLDAALINTVNASMGNFVGISDILAIEPANLADATAVANATLPQRQYAYLSAGLAELAFTTYTSSADPVDTALTALSQAAGNGQMEINDGGAVQTVSLADLLGAALTQVPGTDNDAANALQTLSDAAASSSTGSAKPVLPDDDGDGVPDYRDSCPSTAANATVDANGCVTNGTAASLLLAKESGCLACHSVDKNVVGPAWKDVSIRYQGVADARDQLINKVKNGGSGNWTSVTHGVPMPPYSPRVSDQNIATLVDFILSLAANSDSDGDGVNDATDLCPGTPTGTPVDADGCSAAQRNTDTDGDGVNDPADRCPGTQAGATVDANGCSAAQLDSDGDGVNDAVDQCPGTPAGTAVDATGCPSAGAPADSDGDGVADTSDLCPGTPAGATVDANGCSAAQLDSDGDGVNDAVDQCPGTPAGTAVDATGCPSAGAPADSDGDGVVDTSDLCPGTPFGETVNANGCSASQLDSDADGVTDTVDQCLNTPRGSIVDANGCAISNNSPLSVAKTSGCLACHSVDTKIVGPAWMDVSTRYLGVTGARAQLIDKVKSGGSGNWTDVTGGLPMPPYSPRVSDQDIATLVDFILSLATNPDTDGDGVGDATDLCPGTAAGMTVNTNGCSAAQLDTDGDGVSNLADLCPSTPAGATVDTNGCTIN